MNQSSPSINISIHNNLLFQIKKNWPWILFSQQKYFLKACPMAMACLSELCYPISLTGSNLNSSCKLTIKIKSPACLYFFNDIKPIILISINEFFKSKVINELTIVC